MTVVVYRDGSIVFIHDDDVAARLAELGKARTRRASHVEPDAEGRWFADMGPMNGPTLGPFARRDEAIAAEVAWLERKLFGEGSARDENEGSEEEQGVCSISSPVGPPRFT